VVGQKFLQEKSAQLSTLQDVATRDHRIRRLVQDDIHLHQLEALEL
jgi:hypothetical protein